MQFKVAALALAGVVLAAPSFAADVSRPIAPAVVPVLATSGNPFEGFYAGGHVGYASGNRYGCSDVGDFPAECDVSDDQNFDYDQNGWLVGGQVGVNHVIGGNLLIGGEVSGSLSGISGNLDTFGNSDYNGVGQYNWLGLAEAKIGLTHGNWLLYAQAGVAVAGFDYNSASCSFSSNHQGTAYGGGLAMATSSNNSWFVDYNHIDFETKDAACAPVTIGVKTKPTLDVVKFGFNHYFR